MTRDIIVYALLFFVVKNVASSIELDRNMREFGESLNGFTNKVKSMEESIGNFADRNDKMMMTPALSKNNNEEQEILESENGISNQSTEEEDIKHHIKERKSKNKNNKDFEKFNNAYKIEDNFYE